MARSSSPRPAAVEERAAAAGFVTLSPSSSPPPRHASPPFPSPPADAVEGHFIFTRAGNYQLLCLISRHHPPEGEKKEQNQEALGSAYLFLLFFFNHSLPIRFRDSSPLHPPRCPHPARSPEPPVLFFMLRKKSKTTLRSLKTCAVVF